jgi:predicted O-methyltransferase YrrM
MSFIKLKLQSTKRLNLEMFLKVLLYIKFMVQGRTKYNIHSPFVHGFIEKVLDNKQTYYNYLPLEQLREWLLNQKKQLILKDFGVGSKYTNSKKVSISQLTKTVQSSRFKGQLLFRMVNYFGPDKILELGTSLGITASYLATANKKTSVITVEGDSTLAKIAENNFKKLKLSNVKIINEKFDNVLDDLSKSTFDLIFFDGNHSKKATLKYFNLTKENTKENTIFIFDDIYWSSEMKQAWKIICEDPKVSLTIDLFSIGIVFFKEKFQKEHFKLIHQSNFF